MRLFVLILLYLQSSSVLAQTFTNSTGGPIPDGTALAANSYGAPLDVPIVVSGVANGTIDTLSIAFSANHSFVGDLEVTLISPYGQEHLLFARTGATNNDGGSSANLVAANSYAFSDVPANPNWWAVAGLADVNIPSATARTVLSGGPGVANPAPLTSILSVFRRRPPNGTWNLRFRDGWQGDIGNVSSASITLSSTGNTRTVTKIEDTNDSDCSPADCSLREAITASSDGASSVDRIEFARPFFDSPRRIVLASSLSFQGGPSQRAFALIGPGATLLNVSGVGAYSIRFGNLESGFRMSLNGLRLTDLSSVTLFGGQLLHGTEFAFNGPLAMAGAEINDSSFHSNRSSFSSIEAEGSLALRRVTISGNIANSDALSANLLTLVDCTIVGNLAIGANAVGGVRSPNARLQNTVIAGNRTTGATPAGQDVAGSFQSLGQNLIGDVGNVTSINQASDQTGTSAAPLNPRLSPLSRHGGLIPVHVPVPGSPLLDKGRRVGTDVRGVALVDLGDVLPATGGNNGDIGAVELSPLLVTNLGDNGPGSLRQILQDAPAAPAITDILITPNLPPAAKITLTSGQLSIDKNVSIHGPGARKLTISGNRQSRVIGVQANRRVSISGLTLADGNGVGITGTVPDGQGTIFAAAQGTQVSLVESVFRNPLAVMPVTARVIFAQSDLLEFLGSTVSEGAFGIWQQGGALTVQRSTVLAAVLALDSTVEATITDSTLVSGAICSDTGHRSLVRNSILQGAVMVNCFGLGAGSFISAGHNLVGRTQVTTFTGPGDQVTTSGQLNVRLSPLAYHDGPVPTRVPLAGSPALDKGLRLSADARGQATFDIATITTATGGDNSDIGAVEAQALMVTNTSDSGAGSLRQAVLDANANGVALDDVLFDLPTSPNTITLQSRLPNPFSGGAINLLGPGANQLTLSGNSANQLFSFTAPGHLGMSGLSLSNFRGVDGPALEAFGTEVHLTALEVSGNQASRDGGAMLIADADAVIESSTFAGNSATNNYGAVAYLGNNSRLLVRNSTFSGNSGPASSAIANFARDTGASVLELESTTLASSTSRTLVSIAAGSGAAISRAQNTLFSAPVDSIANSGTNARFESRGFNLSSTSEPLLIQSTDRVNVNPVLGPLQNNGGSTRTHLPQVGSAVIDAGIRNSLLDQRGLSRRDLPEIANALGSDGTDIGAVEAVSDVLLRDGFE
jgi:CSLREA domain-containing protein